MVRFSCLPHNTFMLYTFLDVNVCEIIADLCWPNGECVDLPQGDFMCQCNKGYKDVDGFCESK